MTFLSGLKRLASAGVKTVGKGTVHGVKAVGTGTAKGVKTVATGTAHGVKTVGVGTWKVVKKHPVKSLLLATGTGVGIYALATHKSYPDAVKNLLWEMIKGVFGLKGEFLEEVQGPFFEGLILSGGLKYMYKERIGMLLCVGAGVAVEMLLQDHEWDDVDHSELAKTGLNPFHMAFAVVPCAAGGYVGYKVVQLLNA